MTKEFPMTNAESIFEHAPQVGSHVAWPAAANAVFTHWRPVLGANWELVIGYWSFTGHCGIGHCGILVICFPPQPEQSGAFCRLSFHEQCRDIF